MSRKNAISSIALLLLALVAAVLAPAFASSALHASASTHEAAL